MAIMGDEYIRTLGDAWQHAIGNVIAGAGVLPHGLILSSIVVGIALVTRWKGAKWSFASALPFMPSRGRKANPVRS
jgi:hypothetical protein